MPLSHNRYAAILAQIEREIAEVRAILAGPGDDDSLSVAAAKFEGLLDARRVAEARWRLSRGIMPTANNPRLADYFHRIARWSLNTFRICFASLCVIAFGRFPMDNIYTAVPTFVAVSLLIGSGITYVGAIFFRDEIRLGRKPWQFSLRALLITMTVIALTLGLLAYAAKK